MLRNGNKINGKLIITNQRIYFRAICEDNKQNNKEINPDEISELYFFNTMWIFPNGINIKTKNGENIFFKVSNRNEWAKIITKMY